MAAEIEPFLVTDAAAWRAWLDENEHTHDGVWLLLAKKGTTEPTSLTYDQALQEALCSGWIDGQKRSHDEAMFLQRFTPRRKRSIWSQRNVGIVGDLIAQGRMRDRGHDEIRAAQNDGRWERAYPGAANAEVPVELAEALAADSQLAERFAALGSTERFSLLFPLITALPAQRASRLEKAIATLQTDA